MTHARRQIVADQRSGGDHHQIRRDRPTLAPPRLEQPAPADGDARRAERGAVRHHDVPLGRADGPAHRRLVAGVIHRGEPVPRAVGPVVAEPGPSALLILSHDQAVTQQAVVHDANAYAVPRSRRQRHVERVARVQCTHARTVHLDDAHVHRVDEIETQSRRRGRAKRGDGEVAAQERTRVGKHEPYVVVEDVDAGLVARAGHPRRLLGTERSDTDAQRGEARQYAGAGDLLPSAQRAKNRPSRLVSSPSTFAAAASAVANSGAV